VASGVQPWRPAPIERVRPGQIVGLGSGRAATAFVRALGGAVRGGLRVSGVPTSEATAALAREVGIPLVRWKRRRRSMSHWTARTRWTPRST
jgi:ribose 5-phosphate isomerase